MTQYRWLYHRVKKIIKKKKKKKTHKLQFTPTSTKKYMTFTLKILSMRKTLDQINSLTQF